MGYVFPGPPFKAGRGKALGNPTGTPSLATNGAGLLTGIYKYAYTEQDGSGIGETGLSPIASITAAGNTVRVTMPLPRRGTDRRKLYRTKRDGSTFFLVHDFGGANGYFQTVWDDNTADSSLGQSAPPDDSTALYELNLNAGVKTICTHPDQGSNPADLTILTSDPATAGAYAIDAYGPIYCRTVNGTAFGSLKTGTSGNHIQCDTVGTIDDGSSPTTVFSVDPLGSMSIAPTALVDGGNNAFQVAATFPTVITADRTAVYYNVTGAGSSNFKERALALDFQAGYTGAADTIGFILNQFSAGSGNSYGMYCRAQGAAGLNVGGNFRADGGTKNVGLWGGLGADGVSPNASFALGCGNGAATDDIFRAYDNAALAFQIRDGGHMTMALAAESGYSTGDWFPGTTQKCWQTFLGSTVQRISALIATQTTDATVANTAAETTLLGTVVGTKTLGANFFVAGKTIRITARGYISNAGTPTLNIIAKLGSVAICSTGAITTTAGLSNTGWEAVIDITCRTTGASGTVIGQGVLRIGTTHYPMVATAPATIDTTASQAVDVTATWGTGSSSNTITAAVATVEVLN